jgi:hypothetical protein
VSGCESATGNEKFILFSTAKDAAIFSAVACYIVGGTFKTARAMLHQMFSTRKSTRGKK